MVAIMGDSHDLNAIYGMMIMGHHRQSMHNRYEEQEKEKNKMTFLHMFHDCNLCSF